MSSKAAGGFPLQRLLKVQIAFLTKELLAGAFSISSQMAGRTLQSMMASRNLTLSPEMLPRHQMVYSLTSMWVCWETIDTRMGIAWFSMSFRTYWLSEEAIFVKHQMASNWSFGDWLSWPSWSSLGTRLQSTALWIGGSCSKDKSLRSATVARIWMIGTSDLRVALIRSKSDCCINYRKWLNKCKNEDGQLTSTMRLFPSCTILSNGYCWASARSWLKLRVDWPVWEPRDTG